MTYDRLTKEQRRRAMQAVKSAGSKIERRLQKALWKKGYRYRKNYKNVVGKPDLVFIRLKIAVFVDSEFWHGYNWKERKHDFKANREFWWNKIEKNIARDKKVNRLLKKEGWIVLRFWGDDINHDLEECIKVIEDAVAERKSIYQHGIRNDDE